MTQWTLVGSPLGAGALRPHDDVRRAGIALVAFVPFVTFRALGDLTSLEIRGQQRAVQDVTRPDGVGSDLRGLDRISLKLERADAVSRDVHDRRVARTSQRDEERKQCEVMATDVVSELGQQRVPPSRSECGSTLVGLVEADHDGSSVACVLHECEPHPAIRNLRRPAGETSSNDARSHAGKNVSPSASRSISVNSSSSASGSAAA